MNNTNYFRAKSYLYKFSPVYYKDWVHDAYLKWYDKTGRNLFDESPKRITQVLKYTVKSAWNKNKFMYQGIVFPKQFLDVESDVRDLGHYYVPRSSNNPETTCIEQDLASNLEEILTDRQNAVLLYLSLGYSQKEVSEILGLTTRRGYKVQDQIEKKLKQVLSEQY